MRTQTEKQQLLISERGSLSLSNQSFCGIVVEPGIDAASLCSRMRDLGATVYDCDGCYFELFKVLPDDFYRACLTGHRKVSFSSKISEVRKHIGSVLLRSPERPLIAVTSVPDLLIDPMLGDNQQFNIYGLVRASNELPASVSLYEAYTPEKVLSSYRTWWLKTYQRFYAQYCLVTIRMSERYPVREYVQFAGV